MESFHSDQQQKTKEQSHDTLATLSNTLTSKVGRVLQALAQVGDSVPNTFPISPFHSALPPNISIHAYYVYVSINAGLTDNQAISVLILIERLCNFATMKGHPIIINSLTIHRLILTAVLVTSKFYNDVFFGNHFIAYVGGVHLLELNQQERDFMEFIDWRLWVDPVEYQVYLKNLNQHFYSQECQQHNQNQSSTSLNSTQDGFSDIGY